ncbi:tdh [Symbiodinium necroappetens]|uniref:Tdh protein n=1 Tax=Symbiodinium necroappetens TaxID=1628268 RepID=A0A812VLB2_9DINO|nr:tdh [Symbiodinium necroappetens]
MILPRNHANWVWSLAWSPDGSRLATGGSDARILIWDAQEAAEGAQRVQELSARAAMDPSWAQTAAEEAEKSVFVSMSVVSRSCFRLESDSHSAMACSSHFRRRCSDFGQALSRSVSQRFRRSFSSEVVAATVANPVPNGIPQPIQPVLWGTSMKALVKTERAEGLTLTTVPKPAVGPNDVLIEIQKTAICGTDVHIYDWNEWAVRTIPTPMVVGHEYCGIVKELGSEVTGLKVGARVTGEGHITCGVCRNCRAGRRHLCRETVGVGVNRPGAFAEYLCLPAYNVFQLSSGVSDDVASFMDALGNATHTALSFDLVGEDVLITGAGPIGVMAAAICRHVGARHVVVTDINDFRLDLAMKCGATRAINVGQGDPTERIRSVMRELHMTEGFDIGLEMSGVPVAVHSMLDTLNVGARVALLGIPSKPFAINWDQVIFKGLEIKGIYGREMFETWYKMQSMLVGGLQDKVAPVITHRYSVDQYQAGFDAMLSGQAGKVAPISACRQQAAPATAATSHEQTTLNKAAAFNSRRPFIGFSQDAHASELDASQLAQPLTFWQAHEKSIHDLVFAPSAGISHAPILRSRRLYCNLSHKPCTSSAAHAVMRSRRKLWLLSALLPGLAAFNEVPCKDLEALDCGHEFFNQIYQQFQEAQREVIIMPFILRPRLKIFSSKPDRAPDTSLADLIREAVRRRVHVWILGWDNAASEKYLGLFQDHEFELLFESAGEGKQYLHLMLDTGRQLLASVYYLPHIKSYVFDRRVAFVGGIDFAENRHDTPEHVRPDPRLVQVAVDARHPTGNEKPWQDAMVKVKGRAAEQVAMIMVERWWTYCKSVGLARAQAMRPVSAILDSTLWNVKGALHDSLWKDLQCNQMPNTGILGKLQLSLGGGLSEERQVRIETPQIQSEYLDPNADKFVVLKRGKADEVDIVGLHALDAQVPEEIAISLDGIRVRIFNSTQTLHHDGATLTARWLPEGVAYEGGEQMCKVTLSGTNMWMGTATTVQDSYTTFLSMIRNAKRFVFIENQYFSSDFPSSSPECQHAHDRTSAVLYSGATNRVAEAGLYWSRVDQSLRPLMNLCAGRGYETELLGKAWKDGGAALFVDSRSEDGCVRRTSKWQEFWGALDFVMLQAEVLAEVKDEHEIISIMELLGFVVLACHRLVALARIDLPKLPANWRTQVNQCIRPWSLVQDLDLIFLPDMLMDEVYGMQVPGLGGVFAEVLAVPAVETQRDIPEVSDEVARIELEQRLRTAAGPPSWPTVPLTPRHWQRLRAVGLGVPEDEVLQEDPSAPAAGGETYTEVWVKGAMEDTVYLRVEGTTDTDVDWKRRIEKIVREGSTCCLSFGMVECK